MGSLFKGPEIDKSGINTIDKAQGSVAKRLRPTGFNAGGLRARTSGGSVSVVGSRGRDRLVNNTARSFRRQSGELANLRKLVAPGASALRESRLAQVEDARQRTISNLRDNLARRRVLGSSFAEDFVNRSEIEFSREKDRIEAETFLQELDLTHTLINEQYETGRQVFATKLGELNIRADLAAGLTAQANDIMKASAELESQLAIYNSKFRNDLALAQAELDAKAQEGAGSFLGKLAGTFLGPIGTAAGESVSSSLFS